MPSSSSAPVPLIAEGSEGRPLFDTDEKVLCFQGPLIYEAKIQDRQCRKDDPDMKGHYYYVHYKGWKRSWDEWVPESRVLKWNDANLGKQQQLKDLHAAKLAVSSTSSSNSSSPSPTMQRSHTPEPGPVSGKKRSRESSLEDAYLSEPQIRLDIPDSLKGQLVDDWENVTRNQQLVSLPRDPTVNEFLLRYQQFEKGRKNITQSQEEVMEEVLNGLRIYFNTALGTLLLYRFERNQYADIRKQFPDKDMADIYGVEHLLRLFVQMPSLIAHTTMEADAVITLTGHLSDIMRYMQKTQHQLFLKDYENATPGYVSLSGGN